MYLPVDRPSLDDSDAMKEVNVYVEILDVDDELNTLERLFSEQEKVIKEMKEFYSKFEDQRPSAFEWIKSALSLVESYQWTVKTIKESCDKELARVSV